ncbi:hypothetical protein ACHAWF_002710 [Thalassiosira exigua]
MEGRHVLVATSSRCQGNKSVELAEYTVAMGLDKEPAFAWWVDYVLKKRDRIIKKAKSKYWRTTHGYGIRVPKMPEEALRIRIRTRIQTFGIRS